MINKKLEKAYKDGTLPNEEWVKHALDYVEKRNKDKRYWNMFRLRNTGSKYLMPFSTRGIGKSYNLKLNLVVEALFGLGDFVYLRRLISEAKAGKVTKAFSDIDIEEITNGYYASIEAWGGDLWITKIVDGKIRRDRTVGQYLDLQTWRGQKGMQFPTTTSIFFDEFMNTEFLYNEVEELQQFVSTVFREREGNVWLCGNRVTKFNPYFEILNISNRTIQSLKQDEIKVYTFEYETGVENTPIVTITFAIENCGNYGKIHSMIMGNARKNIADNEWESESYNTGYQKGEIVTHMVFRAGEFMFRCNFMINENGNRYLFIYPTTKIKEYERVITNSPDFDNAFTSRNLDSSFAIDRLFLLLYNNDKVVFSDNVTGSDFSRMIKYYKMI